MTNKFSRLTALMACSLAVLFFTSFQISAAVRNIFTIDDLKFTVLTEEGTIGTVSVMRNSNTISGNIVIPDSVENNGITYSVSSIESYAFFSCSSLPNIVIPNSVTSIGDGAFNGCNRLMSITIPDSVTSIGYGAFSGCSSLTNVMIPDSVTSIGSEAFNGCDQLPAILFSSGKKTLVRYSSSNTESSYTIPDTVTSIADNAFNECNRLMSITIPDDVTFIGNSAFYKCSWLKSITIPNNVTFIGTRAFAGCSGLTSITIPDSVTSIEYDAFSYCSGLTNIVIPDSVTSIGDSAFLNCRNLSSITLSDNVALIGNYAFSCCYSLTSITLPNSVISIGNEAFNWCGKLTSITIPDSVTFIGNSAFERCSSLANITIPSSVTFIGGSAFRNCNRLKHVYYEGNIPNIGEKLYGLYGIYAGTPETLISYYNAENEESWAPYIVENTWQSRRISNVNGVDYIYNDDGTACVVGVGITDDTDIIIAASVEKEGVPYTVTSISENAFESSNIPTSITIPASITAIKINTFHNCNNLQNIYVDSDNPAYSSVDGVLFNKDQTVLIQYPSGREGEYIIPQSVTSIGNYAFWGCTGTTSLIIPEGVEEIEHNAFYKFKGLQKVQLPSGLKIIGEDAFFGCIYLQEINIPDSVTSISAGAFANCRSLEQLDIPNYIKEIGDSAFSGCKKLKFIYIPDSCFDVGAYMFRNCYSLETAIIGAGVKKILDGFFLRCEKVEEYYEKNFGDPISFKSGNLKEVYFLGDNPGITWNAFLLENCYSYIMGSYYYPDPWGCPDLWVDSIRGKTPILYYLNDRYGWHLISYEEAMNEVRNSNLSNLSGILNRCLNYEELNAKEGDFEYDEKVILSYKGHSPVVVIPDFVIEIGENAFLNCEDVYAIIVPKSVKVIGNHAFANCSHLKTVQFRGEVPTASENIFEGDHCVVYYENGTSGWSTEWKGADVLTVERFIENDFIYKINGQEVTITGYMGTSVYLEIPSEINGYPVTRIKEKAFSGCENLTNIFIPNSVTEIGDHAFWNCKGLTSVIMCNGITSISESMFSGCGNLTNMIIPDSVIEIGASAFSGCISLTSITIPDSVSSIDQYAFENCSSLNSIFIPNSVTEIGVYTFYNCSSLSGVYFEGNVPEVLDSWYYVFRNSKPIIYYREGTEGWKNYFGGRPTVMIPNLSYLLEFDGIVLKWTANTNAVLQVSEIIADSWADITEGVQIEDGSCIYKAPATAKQGFYRLKLP